MKKKIYKYRIGHLYGNYSFGSLRDYLFSRKGLNETKLRVLRDLKSSIIVREISKAKYKHFLVTIKIIKEIYKRIIIINFRKRFQILNNTLNLHITSIKK